LQCKRLAARPDVSHVRLSTDPQALAREVRQSLTTGHLLLSPDPSEPVRPECAPGVARRLAEAALTALDRIGTLVATGGETARAVLDTAGASSFDVLAEPEPGIVLSRVPALDVHLFTKAGGFGDPDALLRCLPPVNAPAPKEK
jgi:4-hydroxythreonine-4-phosphate dehydrogenase